MRLLIEFSLFHYFRLIIKMEYRQIIHEIRHLRSAQDHIRLQLDNLKLMLENKHSTTNTNATVTCRRCGVALLNRKVRRHMKPKPSPSSTSSFHIEQLSPLPAERKEKRKYTKRILPKRSPSPDRKQKRTPPMVVPPKPKRGRPKK